MIAKYLMEPPTSKQLSASSTQIPLYHAHSQESVTHGRREVKTSHDTPFAHDDEYWRRNPLKPPFSYRTLVAKALYAAGVKGRTLKEIYDWIEENFAYFRTATSGNGASWRSRYGEGMLKVAELLELHTSCAF
jgi:hypothetical protein